MESQEEYQGEGSGGSERIGSNGLLEGDADNFFALSFLTLFICLLILVPCSTLLYSFFIPLPLSRKHTNSVPRLLSHEFRKIHEENHFHICLEL